MLGSFMLDRVAAAQDRTTAILGNQAERLAKLEELTQRSDERQRTFEDTIARWAARQITFEGRQITFEDTMTRMAERQIIFEEVERHISGHE